jgi:restriction system protein
MTVDPDKIRAEVEGRSTSISAREDWYTPSGRPRSAPQYEATIANSYLGTTKVVRGKTLAELQHKAEKQIGLWAEQEIKSRIGDSCETQGDRAKDQLAQLEGILRATLDVDDRIDWDALCDRRSIPEFRFDEPEPLREADPPAPKQDEGSLFELFLPWVKSKRLDRNQRLMNEHLGFCNDRENTFLSLQTAWVQRRTRAQEEHARKRERILEAREARNQAVAEFRHRFERGESEAIKEYVERVFERSSYPEAFFVEHTVAYDPASKTVVVDLALPAQDAIPQVVDYKHVSRTGEAKPVFMKPKEHDLLYDGAIKQTVLRTIHEVFESVYTPHVEATVVNGWVTALDKASGNDRTSCVISVSANRKAFEGINLARVDPSECIKGLKGLIAGPLSTLAPVRPIMELNREDSRFVEARGVLADYNSATNLAEIPWEDFEQLVRELFGKIFSGEDTEVKITQASRDQGVDAVAFDPDPIRGGKFVIQAKRYTNVVPVSAVRDLYGTMISEGAAKGILVTTSHFGRDAREFVKDKPVTLIDGPNLVFLLEQHGHQVRIDVVAAKAKSASQPPALR